METNTDSTELRSDEAFAELLGRASPRPVPPAAEEALVREAVHAEWQQLTGRRVRRRRITAFALAASVLLAVLTTVELTRTPVTDITRLQMAAIDKQFGQVSVNARQMHAGQLASIEGGDVVETGTDSGLALAWHDGGSLRVDQGSIVVFEAVDQVYLRQGRIYFDSMAGPLSSRQATDGSASLVIRTDHGLVRHLGTQYMTAVDKDELVVSVREGVVSIDGNVTARASAGQQFAISGSGDLVINETNGIADWEWVEKSTPAVNLDGHFVSEALEWVGRESGRAIRYASEDAERLARETQLRGDMQLPPSRALGIFMLTTDLDARIDGEEIVISED